MKELIGEYAGPVSHHAVLREKDEVALALLAAGVPASKIKWVEEPAPAFRGVRVWLVVSP